VEIAPGQKAFITMIIDCKDVRPGKLKKAVEVWTNDPDNKLTMLTMEGEVLPPGERQ
jgi:hypothetical protein